MVTAIRLAGYVILTLCGHSFSAASVSEMNKPLDAALTAFAIRRLDEPYPYLILDAVTRARRRRDR